MRSFINIVALLVAILIGGAFAIAYGADTIRACTLSDGTVLYTNKDVKGCVAIKIPELGVVPSYDKLKHNEITETFIAPALPFVAAPEISSVLSDTCQLYHEWVKLNSTDQGGLRNNTIDRQQRRVVLTMIFGSGFSPANCK